MSCAPYDESTEWTFRNLEYGTEKTGPLRLYWEADYDSISDDYLPSETDAFELWGLWLSALSRGGYVDTGVRPPIIKISWSIISSETATFEAAPHQPNPRSSENFLTFFTIPVITATDEEINWLRLPVVQKLWNDDQADKGGFITEASGWTPSPLQPTVDLRIFSGAGLPTP